MIIKSTYKLIFAAIIWALLPSSMVRADNDKNYINYSGKGGGSYDYSTKGSYDNSPKSYTSSNSINNYTSYNNMDYGYKNAAFTTNSLANPAGIANYSYDTYKTTLNLPASPATINLQTNLNPVNLSGTLNQLPPIQVTDFKNPLSNQIDISKQGFAIDKSVTNMDIPDKSNTLAAPIGAEDYNKNIPNMNNQYLPPMQVTDFKNQIISQNEFIPKQDIVIDKIDTGLGITKGAMPLANPVETGNYGKNIPDINYKQPLTAQTLDYKNQTPNQIDFSKQDLAIDKIDTGMAISGMSPLAGPTGIDSHNKNTLDIGKQPPLIQALNYENRPRNQMYPNTEEIIPLAGPTGLNTPKLNDKMTVRPQEPIHKRGFWFPRDKNSYPVLKGASTGLDSQLPDWSQPPIHTEWLNDLHWEESLNGAISLIRTLEIINDPNEQDPIARLNTELQKNNADFNNEKNRLEPVQLASKIVNAIRYWGFNNRAWSWLLTIPPSELNRLGIGSYSSDIPWRAIEALERLRKIYPEINEYLATVWPNQGENNQTISFKNYEALFNQLTAALGASPQAIDGARNAPVTYVAATIDNMKAGSSATIKNSHQKVDLLLAVLRNQHSNAEWIEPTIGSGPEKVASGNAMLLLQGTQKDRFADFLAAEMGHAILRNELGEKAKITPMVHECADMAARLVVGALQGYADQVIQGNSSSIIDRANEYATAIPLLRSLDPHLPAGYAISILLKEHPNCTPQQIARVIYQTVVENPGISDPVELGGLFCCTATGMGL